MRRNSKRAATAAKTTITSSITIKLSDFFSSVFTNIGSCFCLDFDIHDSLSLIVVSKESSFVAPLTNLIIRSHIYSAQHSRSNFWKEINQTKRIDEIHTRIIA